MSHTSYHVMEELDRVSFVDLFSDFAGDSDLLDELACVVVFFLTLTLLAVENTNTFFFPFSRTAKTSAPNTWQMPERRRTRGTSI